MKILIVAATHPEIAPFLEKCKAQNMRGSRLLSCNYRNHEIDTLITGAGTAATAFQLGRFLNDKYDLAINVGIAGSFNRDIRIGDVVNVIEDCFGDMGAEDGDSFISFEDLGLGKN